MSMAWRPPYASVTDEDGLPAVPDDVIRDAAEHRAREPAATVGAHGDGVDAEALCGLDDRLTDVRAVDDRDVRRDPSLCRALRYRCPQLRFQRGDVLPVLA